MANAADALSHAIDRGLVEAPGGQWVFLNAMPAAAIAPGGEEPVLCEQGFRPDFLALEGAGYRVEPEVAAAPGSMDGAIVLLGRSRNRNEIDFLRAFNMVRPGGSIVVSGAKTDGVASLRKWIEPMAEAGPSFSKSHCVVFSVSRRGGELEIPAELPDAEGHFHGAGMFSEEGADAGSLLLARHFDGRVRGRVADLGAGWGHLSIELLERSSAVTGIDLHEAEWRALQAAQRNLAGAAVPLTFNWTDVTAEFRKKPYDWVIMNPPFHRGRQADPQIGIRFIEVAAGTLVPGGRLIMVANRQLPYESVLEARFRKVAKLGEEAGFKVFEAMR